MKVIHRGGALRIAALSGFSTLAAIVIGAGYGALPCVISPDQAWAILVGLLGAAFAIVPLATPFGLAGRLAALLVLGFGAQLSLTQALWFPTVDVRPTSAGQVLAWGVIAVQTLVAAALGARDLPGIWPHLRRSGLARWLALGMASVAFAHGAMGHIGWRDRNGLVVQFAIAVLFLAVNALLLLSFALRAPRPRRPTWLARTLAGEDVAPPGLTYVAAVWTVLVAAIFALLVFQAAPRLADEADYVFQARTFAAGRLAAAAPPAALEPLLVHDYVTVRGSQWFSVFPPGWPAVLALGVKTGVAWLVNPLLAALGVVFSHQVLTRLYDRPTASLGALLLAVSPWLVAMSGTLMSHTLTFALTALAWRLTLATSRVGLAGYTAGLAMGALFLTRPVDGLVLGVATGLWALLAMGVTHRWRRTIAYGAGCLSAGALIFAYNFILVGDPLLTPIEHYFNTLWGHGANRLGFGADIGPPNRWGGLDIWAGHSPLEALVQAQFNGFALSRELFGWPVASLGLIGVQLLWGRLTRVDLALVGLALALVSAFALYWFNGGFQVGPRYWFSLLLPLVALSARGGVTFGRLLLQADPVRLERASAALVLSALVAILVFLPWRAVTKYYEFRGFHSDYVALKQTAPQGAVVLILSDDDPDFSSAFGLNDPMLGPKEPIFLRDAGPEAEARLRAALPARPIYFVCGRQTGRSEHAGPLLAQRPAACRRP